MSQIKGELYQVGTGSGLFFEKRIRNRFSWGPDSDLVFPMGRNLIRLISTRIRNPGSQDAHAYVIKMDLFGPL